MYTQRLKVIRGSRISLDGLSPSIYYPKTFGAFWEFLMVLFKLLGVVLLNFMGLVQ